MFFFEKVSFEGRQRTVTYLEPRAMLCIEKCICLLISQVQDSKEGVYSMAGIDLNDSL